MAPFQLFFFMNAMQRVFIHHKSRGLIYRLATFPNLDMVAQRKGIFCISHTDKTS